MWFIDLNLIYLQVTTRQNLMKDSAVFYIPQASKLATWTWLVMRSPVYWKGLSLTFWEVPRLDTGSSLTGLTGLEIRSFFGVEIMPCQGSGLTFSEGSKPRPSLSPLFKARASALDQGSYFWARPIIKHDK